MVSQELDYFRAIIQANMEPLAKVTEVSPVTSLEQKLGNHIWLKREDQQRYIRLNYAVRITN